MMEEDEYFREATWPVEISFLASRIRSGVRRFNIPNWSFSGQKPQHAFPGSPLR
jgi:hypothetical protein